MKLETYMIFAIILSICIIVSSVALERPTFEGSLFLGVGCGAIIVGMIGLYYDFIL